MENRTFFSTLAPPAPLEQAPIEQRAGTNVPGGHPLRPAVHKAITALFLLLIAYSAVRSVYRAEAKDFWSDEVCTWIVAEQPNLSSMWAALRAGADGQPLAYYLVERISGRWIPNQNVAFRIPSIIGFCVAVWCLFVWMKRRYGVLIAAVAGLIPFITTLYDPYSVEARPYTLLVAGIAAALVCYQRVPDPRWTVGMGVCLVLAQSFHHYAILAMTPIVAAEAVFFLKTRWLRKGVWLALACGAAPLAAAWPLLSRLKNYYSGVHYFAHPTINTAATVYNWLFHLPVLFNRDYPTTTEGIILAVVLSLGTLGAVIFLASRSLLARHENDLFFHEPILIALFLAMPLVVYAAAKIGNGSYTERYMLPAVIGVTLGAGYALQRTKPRMVIALGTMFLLCLFAQETPFWITRHNLTEIVSKGSSVEGLIASAGHRNLPVAVSEELAYLTLEHYAKPPLAGRFVSLVDFPAAIEYTGYDSMERQLLVLRSFAPLRVYEFDKFRRKYPTFLVYSRTSGVYYKDWWPLYLAKEGYTVKVLATDGMQSVYLADSTESK
jgi:hypothetical protein